MPFSYYRRLSRADKAIYRRSDALTQVPLPHPLELRPLLPAIERALAADDRRAVERTTERLVALLLAQLKVPPVEVKVLAVRPSNATGELHGLYVAEEGSQAVLRVWMRTAAHHRPVAFRTFVRTVLHEVCHHLDVTLWELVPSFHTEGFFKRESHLARQLLGPGPRRERSRETQGHRQEQDQAPGRPTQLLLPLD